MPAFTFSSRRIFVRLDGEGAAAHFVSGANFLAQATQPRVGRTEDVEDFEGGETALNAGAGGEIRDLRIHECGAKSRRGALNARLRRA